MDKNAYLELANKKYKSREDIINFISEASNNCCTLLKDGALYIFLNSSILYHLMKWDYENYISYNLGRLFCNMTNLFDKYIIPYDILNFWPLISAADYQSLLKYYHDDIPSELCLSQNQSIYDYIMSQLMLYDLRNYKSD